VLTVATDSLDELVLHNTRLRKRNRRALELLVTAGGRSYQDMTDDAVTAWLAQHHPEVVAVIGNPGQEADLATKMMAQRMAAQETAERLSGRR
jgi:hypothetical protein